LPDQSGSATGNFLSWRITAVRLLSHLPDSELLRLLFNKSQETPRLFPIHARQS